MHAKFKDAKHMEARKTVKNFERIFMHEWAPFFS